MISKKNRIKNWFAWVLNFGPCDCGCYCGQSLWKCKNCGGRV